MRVVCEACSAKYQIADDRIAGRKVRIRCRKCGSSIAVSARAGGRKSSPSSAPNPAPADGLSWYVSVTGDERGPFDTAHVVAQISAGTLAWDAYVWRDGYADWKTIGDSDTLVRAVAGHAENAAVHARSSSGEDLSRLLIDDDEPTRISSEAETKRLSLASSDVRHAADEENEQATGTYDVSARNAATARAYGSGTFASRASSATPRAGVLSAALARGMSGSSEPALRGSLARDLRQRLSAARGSSSYSANEEADTLDALEPVPSNVAPVQAILPPPVQVGGPATGVDVRESSPLSLSVSTRASAPSAPGAAAGDGSGLIDIRQLASLSKSTLSSPSAAIERPRVQPEHEVLPGFGSFGNANGLSFATLDSLAPVSRQPESRSVALPLAILSGSAMIAVAAFAAVYITRGTGTNVQSVALEPTARTAQAAQPTVVGEPVANVADEQLPAGPGEGAIEPEPLERGVDEAADREPVANAASKQPVVVAAREPEKPAREIAPRTARAPAEPVRKADTAETPKAATEAAPSKSEPISVDDVIADAPAAAPVAPASEVVAASDAVAAPAPAPAAPKGQRSIDSLLDQAVDANEPAAAPPVATAATQEAPSREQVSLAMRAIEAQVFECTTQATEPVLGTANVELTIAGATGRVMSVRVTGIQGPVGSCIARAARAASFPQFTRERLTVNYPYRLTK